MIKDIVVNLEHDASKDPARNYALSTAEAFHAHLVGIAFAYEPVLPGYVGAELSPILIEQLRTRSIEAARAINDALPFLVKARASDLLIVENDKTKYDETKIHGVEMARHLARHDVKIGIEIVPTGGIDVASAILDHAADSSATLLVMGAYGHSRLREMILGGVTRSILSSMTLPVFMSH
jgi:nucleotide-binding universal stress UspA family protein